MRSLIYTLILISVGLSLMTAAEGSDFSIFLGILILPIVLSVYFQERKVAFSILIGCSILAGISLFFNFRPYFVSGIISSYVILYTIVAKNRKKIEAMKLKYNKEINEKKGKRENLIKENEKMKHYSEDVDRQTEELENLYEITKRMSAYLKMDEIFKILCVELKNNFYFDDCRLIGIQTIKDEVQINAVYDIVTESKLQEPKSYDKNIIDLVSNRKKPLSITSITENDKKSSLNLPDSIVTLLAIPIIINEGVDNVIAVENLKEEDFEKFSIVIGQVALEMRKVKLYQIVEKLSTIDGLTNLLLRRHFMEALKKELQRAKLHNLKLASLMIDIDHFKKINDKYGHLAGDKVLVKIAQIIKDSARRMDLISRYGGEEFAIALSETDKEGAKVVAERIKSQVEEEAFQLDGEKANATVSIGISFFPDDTEDLMELIDLSDKALYEAKRTGRNKICIYKE